MRSIRLAATTMVSLLAGPTRALAHPGHGDVGAPGSWLHYAIEPVHVPLLILVGLLAAGVLLLHRRRPARNV